MEIDNCTFRFRLGGNKHIKPIIGCNIILPNLFMFARDKLLRDPKLDANNILLRF